MNNIVLKFLFDKKKEATLSKKGLLQIEARIIGTNKSVVMSTGIKLYKNQYSERMGFTCKNHPLADAITEQAHEIFTEIHKHALSDKCKTLKEVKEWKNRVSKDSIVLFIESEMKVRKLEYNTLKAHRTLVNKIKAFKNLETFQDLTHKSLLEFDQYMRTPNMSNVSINKMHTLFNMYLKIALNKELIEYNPYTRFSPPKAKNTEPVFLTTDEVERIKSVTNLNEKLDRVRDSFIFQCFTGMAYVDMQNFSKNDIQLFEGREIIRSSRTKTDESFILLFLPIAKAISEKYDYQLPQISNQKYNDYLKLLMAHPDININKKVTTHVARHTFATYLLNNGLSLETVSKTLGHSNIKQTQHYARLLGRKVIEDMMKLKGAFSPIEDKQDSE